MNISSLHSFLASAKLSASTAVQNTLGDTYVVLGNEAADLDSTVSAVILAYYTAHSIAKEEKENKAEGQQTLVFPVINCTREDFPLRTEVLYFLKTHGLRMDHLICKDEIDLVGLQAGGRMKLALVDHNVLAAADAHLQPSIVRVIDHHKRDKPLDRRDIIEPVGSCCTLIAEIVLGLFDTDPLVCSLLHGTIVYDTVNLSATAQRATPKDVQMANELEDCIQKVSGVRPNRNEIYNPLMIARADISQLSTEQLLRKDMKLLKTPQITISVPVLPLLSQKFLELPNAIDALKGHMKANRCTVVLVMGWEIEGENTMRRDVTVFSDSIHKAKQVQTPLENCENLQLQLVRQFSESQAVMWVYNQKNVTLSRKVMLPFLATHFETKAQNQNDVDALAGVEILMPEGEMSPNKLGKGAQAVPSISYTAVQNLGIGDPISQGGSSQSSAYNSCPYTPQNSCAEPEDGFPLEHYFLPSFNSREMIEKIEQKRGKLRGYDKLKDELSPGGCSSYPFTPKNSYVDSSLDAVFEQRERHQYNSTGILNNIDSEILLRKLMEKQRRNDSSLNYSNSSSKSQSLTKLNADEAGDVQVDGKCPTTPNRSATIAFPTRPADVFSEGGSNSEPSES